VKVKLSVYRGSGGIVPRILDLGTRWRWVVSYTPRPLYPQGKNTWYLVPEPVWARWWREQFPIPTGTRTPDHPARSPALSRFLLHSKWGNLILLTSTCFLSISVRFIDTHLKWWLSLDPFQWAPQIGWLLNDAFSTARTYIIEWYDNCWWNGKNMEGSGRGLC
jgi:hypothetical protein